MNDKKRLNQHNPGTMYLERFAKELLERLFSENYYGIEMGDAPDLQMGPDYGIEVTWAMFDDQGQANGILNHIKGQKSDRVDIRYLQTMNRINAELMIDEENRIHGYAPQWGNSIQINELIKAYNTKKKKAENYPTKTIDLFVFPPLAQIDGLLGEELISDFFSTIHEDETNPFHNIIVYEEPILYLYDMHNNQLKKSRGNQTIIRQCKQEADKYSGWSKRNNPERSEQ